MEPHKIANILFYMSLDMDYADALESANEEIDCIARDLEFLKQNGRDVILQALEMIAMENESIPEKWNNKGYKRTLSYGGMGMKNLKKYIENPSYCVEDIAEQLIELSNLESSEELKRELEDGLHFLKVVAENKYNSDYFRVLYNVLLVITGNECF